MKRLCIFESHPVQYHAPVYRELHRLCEASGHAEIHVYYGTDAPLRGHFDPGFQRGIAWDEPLLEGYPATVFGNERGVALRGFRSLHGRGIVAALRQQMPTAVMLTGLRYEFDWVAYGAAVRGCIPLWLRTETQDQAFGRSGAKEWIRGWAYRWAYRPVRRVLPIGRLNAEHYVRHGVPLSRHTPSRYCVVDRFVGMTSSEKLAVRNSVRQEVGIKPSQTLLLFCGKLQAKKNPMQILEALAAMPPHERATWAVVWVGTGELEEALRQRARQAYPAVVHFAGFKNQTELAPWYLASDVLVLPSRQMGETWGLVVNEALMAERRVVVSQYVGCQADFRRLASVQVFDGSCEGLVRSLRTLPPQESTLGQRHFMQRYSVESAAAGMLEALELEGASAGAPRERAMAALALRRNARAHD